MQRKAPLPGRIFARCILQRRFAGLFGYMARISCQSQLVSDAWRANLARKGRFSRPRPLSGCMERKTCHGLTPGNAPRRNLATARPPRTHRGNILPRQPPSRMLLDDILPRKPSTARACCEIAVVPRSRKTPPERSVGQFNNARQHVQETMKIFWYLSLRNSTKNALA